LLVSFLGLPGCPARPGVVEPGGDDVTDDDDVLGDSGDTGDDTGDPLDILERLSQVEGVIAVEEPSSDPAYRFFVMTLEQPADHDNPAGQRFQQHMTLLFASAELPTVMVTSGYSNYWWDYQLEVTDILGANQLAVEHRYFADSVPPSLDWEHLTIEQSARDHHEIVMALQPVLSGPWITTGYSKGGMTASYHRRFFPDDVAGTVAFVAPLSFDAPDERYVDFVADAGSETCREQLEAIQIEALERRDTLLPLAESLAQAYGLTYDHLGGFEVAFEGGILSLPFRWWQYYGEDYCYLIPDPTDSDTALHEFLANYSAIYARDDDSLEYYAPYYVQARHQLGYPALASDHLASLLETEAAADGSGWVPPEAEHLEHEPAAMEDIDRWVQGEGERLMFIYGEYDPWTAGAYRLGGAQDSYLFTVAAGTHGAAIQDLASADREAALDVIERWAAKPVDRSRSWSRPPMPRPALGP